MFNYHPKSGHFPHPLSVFPTNEMSSLVMYPCIHFVIEYSNWTRTRNSHTQQITETRNQWSKKLYYNFSIKATFFMLWSIWKKRKNGWSKHWRLSSAFSSLFENMNFLGLGHVLVSNSTIRARFRRVPLTV